MTTVLLIGSGGREHAIAEAIARSKGKLVAFMSSNNPGVRHLATHTEIGKLDDIETIKKFAIKYKPDFCFVGPELPLSAGVVDALDGKGIPCVGPFKSAARLESSKSFTRNLMEKHRIEGNPKMKIFDSDEGLEEWIEKLDQVAIKPDGLTGGKGVKVQDDHFQTKKDAIDYAKEILSQKQKVIVEEKLEGEEFSLMSLVDGKHVLDCPAVQDHKRAFEGDKGPNTGGMGSYSDSNHLLPFLSKKDVEQAHLITEKVLKALNNELELKYKGVMYGGFMATKDGIKLIEYNARFGDPEAMNVLPIMSSDFVESCWRIIDGNLRSVEFEHKATVCKYLVPKGYPESPQKGIIKIGKISRGAKLYYAAVDQQPDGLHLTSSRGVAVVGIGRNLAEAEEIAEKNCSAVQGPVVHRKDIGTSELIARRIEHIKRLRT
ncbi:MAG: phosphoribosylamine--glycine ligase [Nanoarchaeota archaeon]|nr:MAG: phosphoribosylamine--glycine ligase [Nanoarchaeota archaeon]